MHKKQKFRPFILRRLLLDRRVTKVGLSIYALVFAAMTYADDGVRLDEITVKGEALNPGQGTFTVNVIEAETIHEQHLEQPLRLIEQVPGVDLGAYRQGGVADVFTIRGFTGGGHGSDAGISLDGITLNQGESHSDGYADTNIIIPLELERMSVYKGPVSALYGNFARGGVIEFVTRKRGDYQDLNVSFGSYDTFDAQAAMGAELGSLSTNFAVQSYDTEGWRDNSRYTKANVSGRLGYDISDKTEIALSLRSHAGQWEAPGYIPEPQFKDDDRRRNQAENAENDGGEKSFFAQRVDLNHQLNDETKLLLFAYGTQNDFTRFAKFGYDPGGQTERNYKRDVIALGGSLNGVSTLRGKPLNWVAGLEHYSEETDWRRWNTDNRDRTAATEDRFFSIDTMSLYAQADWALSPKFRPMLGLRYDRFSGDYDNNDPGETPTSNDMNDHDHFSPKLGLRSTITDGIELRSSITNGFALPDGEAKYSAGADDVDTTEYWQYEIGTTITRHSDFFIDMAYFVLDSSDEIVEDPPSSGQYRNYGKTRRSGLEAEINYFTPIPNLEVSLITAVFDSEIRNNQDASLEGKEVPGLAESMTTATIQYKPSEGWGGKLSWRSIGKSYLNGTNTESYEGYDVVNAGLFYNTSFDRGRSLRWYLDVNNLTNEDYAEAVWYGAGDNKNFAPAPPVSVTTGLAIKY